MTRKTKKEIENEKLPLLKKEIIKYIRDNGTVISKDFAYWDTYPVCVKDVCVATVAYVEDRLVFGEFDEESKQFTKLLHTSDDLSYEYISSTYQDMKDIDSKNNKKKLKN